MQVEYLYYDVKSLTEHHYFTVGMNTQVKATRAIQHVRKYISRLLETNSY